ncbi:Outer membrane protein OmpA [Solimonas aquatica]|uniref:Outer membrane protein OmpA n=1 Tax=Solimonas aquatica TaxID=489703 RepID=A0A1H9BAI3_9GAMM|nr:OmpA family protein [Solimonas aquatica]SEP85683.1 Outer membrane protein OmpA [Solimonas aquatica]
MKMAMGSRSRLAALAAAAAGFAGTAFAQEAGAPVISEASPVETAAPADAAPAPTATVPVSAEAVTAPERRRNLGPYVGGGLGYNRVSDQTFEFRGERTAVTQPAVPIELPFIANSGIAAKDSYQGGLFYEGMVGYKFDNGFRTEFELALRKNKVDQISYPDSGAGPETGPDGVKMTTTTGLFNLWYDLFNKSRLHPYLGGGVGFARFLLNKQPTNQLTHGPYEVNLPTGPLVCLTQECAGPRKADDANYAYQLGAGLRWDVTDSLTAGLDYRYLKTGKAKFYSFREQPETHLDASYKAQSLMLSLSYFFLKPPAPPPPPPAAPVAVVAPPPPPPPACSDEKDNDGDGQVDYPADKGCTSAQDNDETDPCLPSMAGQKISLAGCGAGDVIVLRGVNFEFDKDRLALNAKTILDGVADELKAHPDITVEVDGHTDAKGSDAYNEDLSQRRAEAVVRYLTQAGVDASRMSAKGFGESHPIADNDTDEGREQNRRVELKIMSGGSSAGTSEEGGAAAVAPAADAASSLPATEGLPASDAAEVTEFKPAQ